MYPEVFPLTPIEPHHKRILRGVVLRLHKHIEEGSASMLVNSDVPVG